MKKTWDGIRSIINVTKKTPFKINKLQHQGNMIDDGIGMANAMNNFFVNIGSTVEAKIPYGKKSYSSYLGERNISELQTDEVSISDKKNRNVESLVCSLFGMLRVSQAAEAEPEL